MPQVPIHALHHALRVVAGLLVEERAARPRVAEGKLAVDLARRARAAEAPDNSGQRCLLRDAVLLYNIHADLSRNARGAVGSENAEVEVKAVGRTLEGSQLAGGLAGEAKACVDALRHVAHTRERTGTPLAGHSC